jgi:hypothetical protein
MVTRLINLGGFRNTRCKLRNIQLLLISFNAKSVQSAGHNIGLSSLEIQSLLGAKAVDQVEPKTYR